MTRLTALAGMGGVPVVPIPDGVPLIFAPYGDTNEFTWVVPPGLTQISACCIGGGGGGGSGASDKGGVYTGSGGGGGALLTLGGLTFSSVAPNLAFSAPRARVALVGPSFTIVSASDGLFARW